MVLLYPGNKYIKKYVKVYFLEEKPLGCLFPFYINNCYIPMVITFPEKKKKVSILLLISRECMRNASLTIGNRFLMS